MTQEELREKLKEYIRTVPIIKTRLAADIGISVVTLYSFLRGRRIYPEVWKKLEDYLEGR